MNGTDFTTEIEHLQSRIRELAPVKQHHLSPHMVNGKVPLTVRAARMVVANLEACQDKPGQPAPAAAPQAPVPSLPVNRGPVASEHKNPPPISAFQEMPAGYYATPSLTGNNDYDFWRLDKPESGKWAGRLFVKRIVGGGSGDEMQSFQLSNIQQRLACKAIMDMGPDESQTLFAAEMTRCIDCGRALTDKISRDERRGPTCRNKRG